jgi:AcrR family transcriptional regulator
LPPVEDAYNLSTCSGFLNSGFTVPRPATKPRTSPRKFPSQERSRATVDVLLRAAARVFQREGYAAATTNRIAAAAGVSVGSLYEYFPNKDAILAAIARAHLAEGVALVVRMLADVGPEAPLDEQLRALFEAVLALHEENPRLHRVLFEETPLPSMLRRELEAGESALSTAVALRLESHPEVKVPDPAVSARLIVRVVESLAHGFVLDPTPAVSREQWVDESVALVTSYLTAGRGRARRSG